MADYAAAKESAAASNARRSTRVFQAVPLSVSGQTRVGNLFLESTSAVAVNCHGCLYPSRHEYRHGSWVTLEVPNQQVNTLSRPVRAQVKFIRLPRSPQDLYLVGVEFESPANVWNLKSSPEDWVPFTTSGAMFDAPAPSDSGSELAADQGPDDQRRDEQRIYVLPDRSVGAESTSSSAPRSAEAPGGASASSAVESTPSASQATAVAASPAAPSEQLLRLLDGKLQQAAERALSSILTSRLNNAIHQAVKAIENFSHATVRQLETHCLQYRETLVSSMREELLCRLQADLAEAGEHLRKQVEAFSSKTLENIQYLERSAAQVQPLITEAQTSLQALSEELQGRFSAALRETAGRAAAEFDQQAARSSQSQLAGLIEKIQAAGEAASGTLNTHSTQARAQLETVAGDALADFRGKAGAEIEAALNHSRQAIESSLASLAEARENWDARQRTSQEELSRACQQQTDQFRQRLAHIVSSSMIASISAINEHSSALLDALAKEASEQFQPSPELAQAKSSS